MIVALPGSIPSSRSIETPSRFIDSEMAPFDEAARERGHVGHELWLKAGGLGLLCADIPTEYGGGGGDFLKLRLQEASQLVFRLTRRHRRRTKVALLECLEFTGFPGDSSNVA